MTDDIRTIWQNQQTEDNTVTLADIHNRAMKFRTAINWRNTIEYGASVVVIGVFGAGTVFQHDPLQRIAAGLIVLATLFVAYQVHQRASAVMPPSGGTDIAAFFRGQLVRQRDALRSIWLWYMAPFMPGLVLSGIARWIGPPALGRSVAEDHTVIVLCTVIMLLMLVAMGLWNALGAAKLERAIADLDSQRG